MTKNKTVSVRLSEEELAALNWLALKLTAKYGAPSLDPHTISDALRFLVRNTKEVVESFDL